MDAVAWQIFTGTSRLDDIRNLRKLHRALQKDVEIFTEIWERIKDISPEKDAKLQRLKSLLETDLRGKKVLIFTYYKDTARYLYRELGMEKAAAWRKGSLFFYFTAPDPSTPDARQHFWRYYDLSTKKITDNRFTIASLIACSPDTPRFLGEADVFGSVQMDGLK